MNENAVNLLEGNLKRMCDQTDVWIEDIEFNEEELNFFNSLIAERINNTTTEDLEHKQIYRNIDVTLYKLSEDLVNQIKMHRKDLSKLINSKDIVHNGNASREHLHLLEKMELLKKDIKSLKRALFKYIKKHPYQLDFE